MKTIFLSIIISILILYVISNNNALGQYGGPVMGPSVYVSDLIASENNVYVTWNGVDPSTKSPDIFLKISNDSGMNFGKTINLGKYGISPYDLPISNVKVASSGSNLYLAWTDWKNNAANSDIFVMKSIDGGSIFSEPLKVKGGEGISGVSALASSGNNVYVLMYNNTNSAYSDLLFAQSNDGGTTFGKPLSLSTNHKFMIGNPQMIVSGNDIYVVADGSYWGSQNGAIVFLASHDGGASFEHKIIIDDVMAYTPQLGVSGDSVYLVWMQMNGKNTSLFLEKSQDGGKSFGEKIQLNQEGEPRWPQLVVSGNDLFVKWVQSFPSGGSKLLFSKSTDGGNTFSKPFNLGGFTTGFDFSQIGILKNENLFAVWIGEYDPSYSHAGVFFRKSVDAGKTFGAIYDLNVENKARILNPKVASSENNIYVAGDTGMLGTSDVIFRSSTDSGETFSEPSNLNSDQPVKTGVHEPLLLVPEFKPDIPQSEPQNSQFSNSQLASFVLGQPDFTSNSPSPTASTFFTPHFITFDSQGNLWVSDGGNDRVLEFSPPFMMGKSASIVLGQTDFTSWQVLNGTNPKSLNHPQGLAFDIQGNLWVADGASNRVLKFKPQFRTGQEPSLVLGQKDLTSGEQPQSTVNSFYYPEGIAFDREGNLWVADTNNRLLEFNPPFSNGQDASLILGNTDTVTSQGVAARTISVPMGITFDSQGNLWVADSGGNRILRFDTPFSSGQAASLVLGHQDFTTGGEGVSSNASSLRDPFGIAFDSQGNLWVADSGNNRILEFTSPFTNGQRASLILGQASFNAGAIDTMGHTADSLNQPHGIAFDKNGNLLVADSANNRIFAYKSRSAMSGNSPIVFPNSVINSSSSEENTNSPSAYEEAANKMEECSRKLGIASDNQTAINLVLGSSEFQSRVLGYDYKLSGIANSFHFCSLDTLEAVYALSDKDGKYVKSLYVSIDPSLTKILGIREEVAGARYGGVGAALPSSNAQQNKTTLQQHIDLAQQQNELNVGGNITNYHLLHAISSEPDQTLLVLIIGIPILAIAIAVSLLSQKKKNLRK